MKHPVDFGFYPTPYFSDKEYQGFMFSLNSRYRLKFPIRKYLNQPLFNPETIINPHRFWRNYQRQYLQACWEIDSRLFLEACWQMDCLFYSDFML